MRVGSRGVGGCLQETTASADLQRLCIQAGSSAANLAKVAEPSPALLSALCRQHYATGDHASLHATYATLAALPPSEPASARAARKTAALAKIADGDWPGAEADWRALVADDPRDLEVRTAYLAPFRSVPHPPFVADTPPPT